MKAQLTFTLPDERQEFDNATDAGRAFSLLADIVNDIRSHEKYDQPLSVATIKAMIYDEFPDIAER